MISLIRKLLAGWNRFFHDPTDMRIVGPFRIAYSWLLLLNALNWAPDLEKWFGTTGVIDLEAGKWLAGPDLYSILWWANTPERLKLCYWIFVIQIVCLLIGFLPRLQSICVFIWFASFEHRNLIMFDGQDNLFRMLAFLMIFMPTDRFLAVDQLIFKRPPTGPLPPWPLRLVQFQMCILYLSSAVETALEGDWSAGHAIYYTARLDDFFGKHWVPQFFFHSNAWDKFICWSVIIVEIAIPIFVWLEPTRRLGIILGLGLHLSLQYAMFIFLFQWLMITGLLTFSNPKDWADLRRFFAWVSRAARGTDRPPALAPAGTGPPEPQSSAVEPPGTAPTQPKKKGPDKRKQRP